MRTKEEMLSLITDTARGDDRIRAVYMGGSRANPRARQDIFQDYDIGYIVRDTKPFREDKHWIDRFGKRLYMQYPEEFIYSTADVKKSYGWLIQFADGNRMDLHVCTPESARDEWLADHMYIVLLDKDGILPAQHISADSHYWIRRPTQKHFLDTANEFWWCLNNVAKGLWREELPYVMDMLDSYVRPMLMRMIEWQVGAEHAFSVSIGKSGKYMRHFVSSTLYEHYLSTYSGAGVPDVWRAVFSMCDLFDQVAGEVSRLLGFTYNTDEAKNSRGFLQRVKNLPKDAAEV